jgi:glycosyltransferase involved in cell wall biosynthesis
MRLLIISHVVHYAHDGRLYAYGPYTREIELWAELFDEVTIASPCRYETPPGDCLSFSSGNIHIAPQIEATGGSLNANVHLLLSLPVMFLRLACLMRRYDAVHVRCPGNLGCAGAILAPLLARHMVAKYAAQWPNFEGEPWTMRFQKVVLRRWFKGPVTVYGRWPDEPSHVVPFFTSLLTREQMERACRHPIMTPDGPLRLLYTGRLSRHKNTAAVVEAVAVCEREGIPIHCTIVGDGPERQRLEQYARTLGITASVQFTGSVPFEQVLDHLERADVLALNSRTEGWPKSIAEAMAFGLICIGSNCGLVPQMLADGRGFVIPPGDARALASVLRTVATDPGKLLQMRRRAAAWARHYSLDGLQAALRDLLETNWSVRLEARPWGSPLCNLK